MSAATDFLEDELLDHILNNLAYPSPTIVAIALSTTTPNDDGSNVTEPVGNGYARQDEVGNFTLTGGGSGEATNTAAIEFPEATGSWGTLTHFVIYDALSGGNALIYGTLGSPVTVGASETVRFQIGDLAITVA